MNTDLTAVRRIVEPSHQKIDTMVYTILLHVYIVLNGVNFHNLKLVFYNIHPLMV